MKRDEIAEEAPLTALLLHALFYGVAIVLAGCAGSPSVTGARPPEQAPPNRPLIAQRCALSRPDPRTEVGADTPRVLVELAVVVADRAEHPAAPLYPLPRNFARQPSGGRSPWLDDPRIQIVQIANVELTNHAPATVALDIDHARGSGRHCVPCTTPERWDATLTAHLANAQASKLQLALELAPAPPLGTPKNAWYIPEHRRKRMTVALEDQQTVAAAPVRQPNALRPWLAVLTPYIIRRNEDRRLLFECKARHRTHAISAPVTSPADASAAGGRGE
ncbi:hypothetical protein ACFL5O_06895 [Myxococcota bacterium]